MPVVRNVARDPADEAVRATVTIRLIAGDVGSVNTPGYTIDGTVLGTHQVHTDDDGFWSIDLAPNDDYLPDGTFYEVGERPAGTRVTYVYYAQVPDVPGPVDLVSILVDPVDVPDALYLLATQKGAAGGLATLDAGGQVPADQLGNASGGGGGGAVSSVFGRTGVVTAQSGDYTKAQVGLSNVDNTTDTGKPVSTLQAAADTAVANTAAAALATHAADTTAVHGITDTAGLVPLTWINAKAQGAVGNGATDDTAALQAAINAVPAAGGVLYLPAGQYLISDPLIGKANLTILGDGHPASIIIQQDTAANGLTFVDSNNVTIKGIRLQGPASGTGVGISAAISSAGVVFRHVYEGVYVREFGSHGIDGDHPAQVTLTNVTAESNGGHGFNFYGTALAVAGTSVTMSGCYANNNGQAGFRLFKMVYSETVGCAADHNGIGYLIDTCQSIDLGGSGAEYPQNKSVNYPGIGFKVTGGSRAIVMSATWVNHNISVGWHITGSSTGIVLNGAHENEPESTATYTVQVDAGCQVVTTPIGSTDGAFAPRPNSLAAGTTVVLATGATASTFAAGNDARLSDTRTPTAHAASHGTGQADAVTVAQSQVTGLAAALAGLQPLDTDLTTIAGLASTTDNVVQAVGSAWASRTPAQLKATLALAKADVGLSNVDNTTDAAKPVSTLTQTALDGKQPLDADLTTIAGLTATTDNVIQSVAGAWASRTPAQVKTALALNNVDNTADTAKPVSTAQQTALDLKANLASPTFTGTPTLPTGTVATTQTSGNNTTAVATTAFVQTASGLLVPKSTVTAKGDLIVATGSGAVTNVAVGSNDFVLTADSAQASGVKWAAAAGGGSSVGAAINPKGSRWQPIPMGRAGTNYTPVINRLHLIPLPIGPTARQITGVSFEIATAAGAGGLGRACLFSSLSTWEPNVEIIDWGTKVTTGTGALTWTGLTQNVSANTLYWLGFNPTVAAPVLRGVDGYNPYVNLTTAVTGTTSFGMFVMNSVTASTGASPFVYFDVDLAIRASVQFA